MFFFDKKFGWVNGYFSLTYTTHPEACGAGDPRGRPTPLGAFSVRVAGTVLGTGALTGAIGEPK